MKMRSRDLLCVLICTCALIGAGCSDLFMARNNFENNQAWTASQQARVVAAGKVVDVTGKPLEGVRMTAEHVYLRPTFQDLPRADTIREYRNELVNGSFRMIFSWADEVQIRFSKPGYRDVTVDLDVQPQEGGDDSLARYPKARPVTEDKMTIVMRPLPPAPSHTTSEASTATER